MQLSDQWLHVQLPVALAGSPPSFDGLTLALVPPPSAGAVAQSVHYLFQLSAVMMEKAEEPTLKSM